MTLRQQRRHPHTFMLQEQFQRLRQAQRTAQLKIGVPWWKLRYDDPPAEVPLRADQFLHHPKLKRRVK